MIVSISSSKLFLGKRHLSNLKDLEKVDSVRISNEKLRTALEGKIENTKKGMKSNMSRLDKLEDKEAFGEGFTPPSGDLY